MNDSAACFEVRGRPHRLEYFRNPSDKTPLNLVALLRDVSPKRCSTSCTCFLNSMVWHSLTFFSSGWHAWHAQSSALGVL